MVAVTLEEHERVVAELGEARAELGEAKVRIEQLEKQQATFVAAMEKLREEVKKNS